jgi:glutaconate CoA-transferase subunit A
LKSNNKVMSMKEAISKFIHDGDCIALGGFVTNRKPYAAVREIIRQGIKDLYVEGGPAGGDVRLCDNTCLLFSKVVRS